jgi:hypothetical protein
MNHVLDKLNLFDFLADHTKVWVYQSSRIFDEKEQVVLRSQLNAFVQNWSAHGSALSAAADVVVGRFVVLAVDERAAGASGCSIDKSVHFLQDIESQYAVQLFERTHFAYLTPEKSIQTVPMSDFQRLYTEGVLDNNTLVFDNMVNTLGALRQFWVKPLGESWHRRFVGALSRPKEN